MAFTFEKTKIPGVVIIQPQVFGDNRGYFMETYKKEQFVEAGINKEFVQDNESSSTKGVLRGLHFQKNHTQGKLVRVTHGEVYDVAVDVRPGSETFGQWVGVTLSAEKKNMFYIPEGFAHGFLVLSDTAEFVYKCTDVYDPSSEGGIPWNDPSIAVEWPEIDAPYLRLLVTDGHLDLMITPFDASKNEQIKAELKDFVAFDEKELSYYDEERLADAIKFDRESGSFSLNFDS